MERAYIAQFGASLYRMFFQRYSEKVWGRPCTELSADWVAQRSRGLSVWALAREFVARLAQRRREFDRSVHVSAPRVRPYLRPHG